MNKTNSQFNQLPQYRLDPTREELDFQGQEDEKIINLRREILRKEEERKISERKLLLDKAKKPLLETRSNSQAEKTQSFKLRKQYNNSQHRGSNFFENKKFPEFNQANIEIRDLNYANKKANANLNFMLNGNNDYNDKSNNEGELEENIYNLKENVLKPKYVDEYDNIVDSSNRHNNYEVSKKAKQDMENYKFVSGSNYNYMIPQIGVTLVEEGKIKSGGSDYYKIFGKLSLHDYEKIKKSNTSKIQPCLNAAINSEPIKIKDISDLNNNEAFNFNNNKNLNINSTKNPTFSGIPVIKGFTADLKENLFLGGNNDENVIFNSNIVYNENIFKNKKYSELRKKPSTGDDGNLNSKGLLDILQDKNWGNSNKNKGFNNENNAGSITHGKIYRDLGKVIAESNNMRTRKNRKTQQN